ncbi:MAG TPA: NADP-dependent oxidoreductase [Paracoccaceae bacterium]|nr:NADP-dependent oxidoreductase [Paracoccaceae bacterium]
MKNQQIVLGRRPVGAPVPEDFAFVETELPPLAPGEVLVRLAYLGLEPAARPRMNAHSPYSTPIAIGGVVSGTGTGVVVESRSPLHRPGDHVFVQSGWQRFCVVPAGEARRIDPALAPLPKWLSLLGLSAFTAYIGITELARPQPGETVVVSAASGATGAVAGQIARILGARAVGIAGGPEKCRHAEALGFDACIDYRQPDFAARLDAACPDGIDVDFENVGGEILRTVFERMNRYGRVILCGLVAEYHELENMPPGPNLWRAVYNALRIEGFLASRYFGRLPEFVEKALAWSAEGRLQHSEHIVRGFENVPSAFLDLLAGRHLGKVMVALEPG